MKHLLKSFFPLHFVLLVEGQKSRFPSGVKIGGVYKASLVGRSDDKMIYKMADSGISVSCPLDLMDGKKSIVKAVKLANSVLLIIPHLWLLQFVVEEV